MESPITEMVAETAAYTSADVTLLAAYVLLALLFSFLCSVAEAVLLSMTPSFIHQVQSESPGKGLLLAKLRLENVDQSLAAILTLNTIAHTVGAVGAGAQATKVFGNAWIGLFSAIMTLLILFFSEIIPKTIGAIYWRGLARPTAFFVNGLIRLLYPLIWVSERLTRLISRGKAMHIFSRDEFLALADVGEQTGHIGRHELRIFRNLFELRGLRVMDIMTPRIVINSLAQGLTLAEASEEVTGKAFSRFPLIDGDIDHVTGFVLKQDILGANLTGDGDKTLDTIRRDIRAVPQTASLPVLMESLLKERQLIALVVDEYGGTAGLVTLEDIVETLLGMEIVDEMDEVSDMQALARKQWERRAQALKVEIASKAQEPE